jgi:hypothetical protein
MTVTFFRTEAPWSVDWKADYNRLQHRRAFSGRQSAFSQAELAECRALNAESFPSLLYT